MSYRPLPLDGGPEADVTLHRGEAQVPSGDPSFKSTPNDSLSPPRPALSSFTFPTAPRPTSPAPPTMGREWSRDHFPRQQHAWQQDRFPNEHPQDDNRGPDPQSIHRPPIDIARALREHCNIPGKAFFVAVILDNDETATFAGPGRHLPGAAERLFDMNSFIRYAQQAETGSAFGDLDFGSVEEDQFRPTFRRDIHGRRISSDRRRSSHYPLDNDQTHKARKRPRPHISRHNADDDDPPMMIAATKKAIPIGDSDAIWNFYQQRFKNCQQTACKLIAKAWVKAVEPKKQSHHPYTGKDEKAPEWWPKPWGTMKDERVRHKEPDHLYKKERVHLLTHILRLIVEPSHKQHPDVQKSGLNVRKLEEVTTEALSSFFSDPENPGNSKKRPFLSEIFKVARNEERYKNGEIDGDTDVYVMADDKMPELYQAESEGSTKTHVKDEEHHAPVGHQVMSATKPISSHHMIPASGGGGPAVTNALPTQSFLSDLPVRGGTHLPPQVVQTGLTSEQQPSYVEGSSIGGVGNTSVHHGAASLSMSGVLASPHDPSDRRHSLVFNSPTDFSAPTNTNLYSQQWQPTSTAPATSPMYSAFTHSHTHPHPQPNQSPATYGPQSSLGLQQGQQPSLSLQQSQQYLPPPFDNMPRTPSFDSGHGHMFRQGSVSQTNVAHSQGYANYLPPDNRALPGTGLKIEPLSRPHMQ